MKDKYWLGAAACLLIASSILWPAGERVVNRARETVTNGGTVEFDSLRRENEDIYAWLYIPGAGINEPVLQREGDSVYYLTHNCLGEADGAGALFTESGYQQKDFSNAAAVIYGKNTVPERQFGALQASYSSLADLIKNEEIIIYLPGQTLRYRAFAAAPFQNYHLLHYFDFSNSTRFRAFLQAVHSVKAVDASWNEEVTVLPGDSLLILSTTRFGSADDIYLVLAKRVQD